MNMGVTYPQAREGRITAAITTAGTADTKAAIMAAAMTRDPAAAVKTREIADMKAAETITAAMTKDPAEVVKTIGTAGTMTAVTAAMAAVMASDPDRAVKTIGTAGIMTAAMAAITAAMTRDPDKAVETKGTAGIMTAATAAAMTRDPAAVMMITGMITEEMLPTDSPAL